MRYKQLHQKDSIRGCYIFEEDTAKNPIEMLDEACSRKQVQGRNRSMGADCRVICLVGVTRNEGIYSYLQSGKIEFKPRWRLVYWMSCTL